MRKFFGQLVAMTVTLAAFGFLAFAYVGDLSPDRVAVVETVTLTLK